MTNSLLRPALAMLAGLVVLGWHTTATAQANLPRAVGLLPADVNVMVAVNLTAVENPRSLVSLFPPDMVLEMAAEADPSSVQFNPTDPVDDVGGVLQRLFLGASDFWGSVDGMALASRSDSLDWDDADEFLVLLGDFTQQDALRALQSTGATDSGATNLREYPRGSEEQVFVSAPEDGVLLAGNRRTWLAQALEMGEERQGLMAADSPFVETAMTLAGRAPDFMLFVPGSLIQRGLQEEPQARGFLGPFAQTRGILLAAFPADRPMVEVHSAFENAQLANLARQYVEQGLTMGRFFLQSAAAEPDIPADQQEMLRNANQALQDVRVVVSRNSCLMRIEMDMPDREAVRDLFRQGMEQAP